MIGALSRWFGSRVTRWFIVLMCASVGLIGAFTYRASQQWQHSATLLASRRAQQDADLLALALIHDMHAVQTSVLSSQDWSGAAGDPSAETSHLLASAFARFSYPEVFFSWRDDRAKTGVQFFARFDRVPGWLSTAPNDDAFPVTIGNASAIGGQLVQRAQQDARDQRRFSIFNFRIGDATYQVVSRLGYRESGGTDLHSLIGFMVDLNWVHEHYFGDIERQVARLAGADSALTFSIAPASAAGAGGREPEGAVGQRRLILAFFDPLVVGIARPPDLTLEEWTIRATANHDDMLQSAQVDARRTLIATVLAALMFITGLAMTLRGFRAETRLTQLRADFVSTVTHELKTPIAAIRAAGDTLVSHRVAIGDTARKYATMVVEQSKQLTRLLDNLLAYSRITDVTEAYAFKPIAVDQILGEVLKSSQPRLESGGFSVTVAIPAHLPQIHADWTALYLAFDNVLDNSIRYSKDRRWLSVAASVTHDAVRIDIADRGIGIPPEEVGQVTRRFFRGAAAGSGGSGLGLAIADRIIADHGGALTIRSAIGVGTTVSVTLPLRAA